MAAQQQQQLQQQQQRGSTRQVQEILQRMQDETLQPQALKTCTSLLTILAREEQNKAAIVEGGIPIVLHTMQRWLDHWELQESGCDLIWTLAFDNDAAKQALCKCGGLSLLSKIIGHLSSHAEVMKSACGALSNLAQYNQCQKLASMEGVVCPMADAIRMHQRDPALLPFILDAFATVVIGDEKSASIAVGHSVILSILAALTRNKDEGEVARSGCHALAILSEFAGHAVLIAAAGSVPVILSLLTAHSSHAELHRVAVVMLFRVLQDTSAVFRDMLANNGIHVLLQTLQKHSTQRDTTIATLHILHTLAVHQQTPQTGAAELFEQRLLVGPSTSTPGSSTSNDCKLSVVLQVLCELMDDKEVVRIACCLLHASLHWPSVATALHERSALDVLARCACKHPDARAVVDCVGEFLRVLSSPTHQIKPFCLQFLSCALQGMAQCIAARPSDPQMVSSGFKLLLASINQPGASEVLQQAASEDFRWADGVLDACLRCITHMAEAQPQRRMAVRSAVTFTNTFLDQFAARWDRARYAEAKRILEAKPSRSPWRLDAPNDATSAADNKLLQRDTHRSGSDDLTAASIGYEPDENVPPSANEEHVLEQLPSSQNGCSHALPIYPSLAAHGMCSKRPALALLQHTSAIPEGLLPPSTSAPLLATPRALPSQSRVVYEERPSASPAPSVVAPDFSPSFTTRLKFSSAFESGNLERVVQRGMFEYDLFLRTDLNTTGHTQWFFFSVSDTHRGIPAEQQAEPVEVRFNVVNLTKPDSLFSRGMQPVMYSCAAAQRHSQGWYRAGKDISYHLTCTPRETRDGKPSYTLSFTLPFPDGDDTYLVAHSYPYTYTDLKKHIAELLQPRESADYVRRDKLCTTIGGNDCDILVFSDFRQSAAPPSSSSDSSVLKQLERTRHHNKPRVVITGRVHPGETPASWMMKGVLNFLAGQSSEARLIREHFVVCAIPMLNPDGVVVGNNRCSLVGMDLNRCWKKPSKAMHPTIFSTKKLLRSLNQNSSSGGVALYLDLHGHSRKFNIFLYGCEDNSSSVNSFDARRLPRLLSTHHTGLRYFNYKDCSFTVTRGREATARVVVARELGIPASYTVEASFCGTDFSQTPHHFSTEQYQEAGRALCESILEFAQACRMIATLPATPADQPLLKSEEVDDAAAAAAAAAAGGTDVVGDDVCSESSDDEAEGMTGNARPSAAGLAITATALPVGEIPSSGLLRLMRQVDGRGRTRASVDGSTPHVHARALTSSQPDISRPNAVRSARVQPVSSRQIADQRALVVRKRLVRSYTTPNPAATFTSTSKAKQR